jgi:thioredoxin reductase (NADPH)
MERTSGEDLLQQGIQQAEAAGTNFMYEDVVKVSHEDEWFIIRNESGEDLRCRALILAMGISRNKLRVPGDEPVSVVGNASAAASGALTMTFYASQVHLVCDQLEIAEALAYQLRESEVTIHEGRKVTEITGLGVAMDPELPQYIATDKKQRTNIAGVLAAGDICGLPWQLAKAVGEGCVAGLEAAAYAKQFR